MHTHDVRPALCAQVREAILTSALLRLPGTMSRAQKEHRVDQILAELARPCPPQVSPYFSCNAWLLLHTVFSHAHTTDGKPGVCLASLAMQGAAEEVATPQHITSHALRQLLAADW